MAQSARSPYHIDAKAVAMIMAGGRSERMRSSFGDKHKSLVPILGVTLLERNICAFAGKGFRHIVVATSEHEIDVHEYVQHRAPSLLASIGGTVECLKESNQLGTIGAAGQVSHSNCDCVVVANVDNLTTLDWNRMLAYHRRKGAAMTVAAHRQPFRSPFGELTVQAGNVVRYAEKPTNAVLISSGCYVLDSETCRLIAPGQRTDVPDLVRLLLEAGRLVAAFEHEYPWVDVNDAQSVADAERLVARHFTDFECWHPKPHAERIHLLVRCDDLVLAATCEPHHVSAEWDLPQTVVHGDIGASAAMVQNQLGIATGAPQLLGAYDDLDEGGGSVIRRHIFLCVVPLTATIANSDRHVWVPVSARDTRMSSVMSRALSLLIRMAS